MLTTEDITLIKIDEVLRIANISHSQLYRLQKNARVQFPKAVQKTSIPYGAEIGWWDKQEVLLTLPKIELYKERISDSRFNQKKQKLLYREGRGLSKLEIKQKSLYDLASGLMGAI